MRFVFTSFLWPLHWLPWSWRLMTNLSSLNRRWWTMATPSRDVSNDRESITITNRTLALECICSGWIIGHAEPPSPIKIKKIQTHRNRSSPTWWAHLIIPGSRLSLSTFVDMTTHVSCDSMWFRNHKLVLRPQLSADQTVIIVLSLFTFSVWHCMVQIWWGSF